MDVRIVQNWKDLYVVPNKAMGIQGMGYEDILSSNSIDTCMDLYLVYNLFGM